MSTQRTPLKNALTAILLATSLVWFVPGSWADESPAPPATQVVHRTVQVDDLDIFYREAGPKDAPTLLLLHGFPT